MLPKTLVETKTIISKNGFEQTYRLYTYNINTNVIYEWRRFGKLDSPDDLPAIVYPNMKYWYKNGRLHREHGPAIIREDLYFAWYYNDGKHRNDGPAIINGDIKEYWWKNKQYDFERWSELATLNKQEKIEIILQYG